MHPHGAEGYEMTVTGAKRRRLQGEGYGRKHQVSQGGMDADRFSAGHLRPTGIMEADRQAAGQLVGLMPAR